MNETKNTFVPPALVIGVALVVASLIGGVSIANIQKDDTISVTGSAKMLVSSDTAKLQGAVVRKVSTVGLTDGYTLIEKDLEAVKNFLATKGVVAEELLVDPVTVNEVFDYSDGGSRLTGYELKQSIKVTSQDITKITSLANSIDELASKNVFFQSFGPEYYYTKLSEARVSLLGEAIADAKARATEISKASGDAVGGLVSASSGVVQVLAPNSVDISDYGSYDTSTIEKDVTVTVRAYFGIK